MAYSACAPGHSCGRVSAHAGTPAERPSCSPSGSYARPPSARQQAGLRKTGHGGRNFASIGASIRIPGERPRCGRHYEGVRKPWALQERALRRPAVCPVRAVAQDGSLGANEGTADSNHHAHAGAFLRGVQKLASDHFLPLALMTGIALGFTWPGPGQVAQQQWGLSRYSTFCIFLISGLTLRAGSIRAAAEAWPALAYGLVAILGLTPLASLLALRLPLNPPELAVGLALFCCMPTTLSSGVSLTQTAGANVALALALTVLSNLIGIISMPIMLSSLVARGAGVSVPAGPLIQNLIRTILIPLILGVIARASMPGLASWVDRSKRQLSKLSSALLSLVPWMQVSCSKEALLRIAPHQLLAAAGAGIAIHLMFLIGNAAAVRTLHLGKSSWERSYWPSVDRAVIITASMKALPVAVVVVDRIGSALGQRALLLLPCIATHLLMITIDSVLVSFWLGRDREMAAASGTGVLV